jgi:hypothetical protein
MFPWVLLSLSKFSCCSGDVLNNAGWFGIRKHVNDDKLIHRHFLDSNVLRHEKLEFKK